MPRFMGLKTAPNKWGYRAAILSSTGKTSDLAGRTLEAAGGSAAGASDGWGKDSVMAIIRNSCKKALDHAVSAKAWKNSREIHHDCGLQTAVGSEQHKVSAHSLNGVKFTHSGDAAERRWH